MQHLRSVPDFAAIFIFALSLPMLKNLLFVNSLIFIFVASLVGWAGFYVVYPLFDLKESILSTQVQAAETAVSTTTPPVITNINVDEVTPTSTTISWVTDKESDSLINYSLSRDYGTIRIPESTKEHKLVIPDLLSDKFYYFRVVSSDAYGNQSISNDFSFVTKADATTTPPPPVDENPVKPAYGEGNGPGQGGEPSIPKNEQQIVNQVINLLDKVSSEDSLSLIESKIDQEAQEKAAPPVISGDFAKVEVGTDWATITWKTDKDSNSIVSYASESDYNANSANGYRVNQGEPNEMVQQHKVEIRGLSPATTYHYRVSSKSALDLQSVSEDNTFKTKSVLPEIFNATVAKAEEDAATIEFTTNVPCSAVVEYTDLNTNIVKLEGSPLLVTSNSIRIKDLTFDTYYSVVIKVENEQGEKTVSEPLSFKTIKDIVPPVISSVKAKSNLDQGTDNTQTIINWRTDEMAICQLKYKTGVDKNQEDAPDKKEDTKNKDLDYVTNHIQVLMDFKMASVYKYWIECSDKTGNKVRSDNYTILTPVREQSILDIILKNFEGTFGWLKKK